MNLFIEDFKVYNPALHLRQQLVQRGIDSIPIHKNMNKLHFENVEILNQIILLEEEMYKQDTKLKIENFKFQIGILREKINSNNNKLKHNIHELLQR